MTLNITAHLDPCPSDVSPTWSGFLLDDVPAGSVVVSDDQGDTWRLPREDRPSTVVALVLQDGTAGTFAVMISANGGTIRIGAPSFPLVNLIKPASPEMQNSDPEEIHFITGEFSEDGKSILLNIERDEA